MQRGCGSAHIVVEEEKRGNSASIQAACFLGGARPVRLPMPMPQRYEWPTTCAWRPGDSEHPRLSALLPWERSPEAEAFPGALVRATPLTKVVLPMAPYLRRSREQGTMVQHGRVFTPGPASENPYTIQLFKVLQTYSF